MRKILFLILMYCFVSGVKVYAQNQTIDDGWKQVKICGISIIVPKNLKHKQNQGYDTCVDSLESKKSKIAFDRGYNGGSAKDAIKNLQSESESIEIDGKKSKLAIYNNGKEYKAILYVEVRSGDFLSMYITFKNETDEEKIRKIIQSIHF